MGINGVLTKLSSKRAELRLDKAVPVLADLKIQIIGDAGLEVQEPAYCEVEGALPGSDGLLSVRFTSLPPQRFEALCATPTSALRPILHQRPDRRGAIDWNRPARCNRLARPRSRKGRDFAGAIWRGVPHCLISSGPGRGREGFSCSCPARRKGHFWRGPRRQPKTAFSRFPPVHRADLEGQQRVESTHCGNDASRARLRRTPRGHAVRQSSTCSDKVRASSTSIPR